MRRQRQLGEAHAERRGLAYAKANLVVAREDAAHAVGARLRLLRLVLLGLRMRGTRRVRRAARQVRALVNLGIGYRCQFRFPVPFIGNAECIGDGRRRLQ